MFFCGLSDDCFDDYLWISGSTLPAQDGCFDVDKVDDETSIGKFYGSPLLGVWAADNTLGIGKPIYGMGKRLFYVKDKYIWNASNGRMITEVPFMDSNISNLHDAISEQGSVLFWKCFSRGRIDKKAVEEVSRDQSNIHPWWTFTVLHPQYPCTQGIANFVLKRGARWGLW